MEAHALTKHPPGDGAGENPEGQAPIAYLVVVHKGPTWNVSDIEPFCRLLSRRFAGEVWAFGSYTADTMIGRMRLRAVGTQPFRGTANLLQFVRVSLGWMEELRAARVPRLAIVSLEPFSSGLLGLLAAKRARGVWICEVNGVYASRHNTADTRVPLLRVARVLLRRLVGRFVLRRATAVRLLYVDQLQGFVSLPQSVVIRRIFETTNLGAFSSGAEEPLILGVGYPFRVKGFDTLCESFKRISSRFPGWRLVLIGHEVPEEVRAGGFAHRGIEAYPGLKHGQVAEWMNRCAIFALPSRTEAMGRVLLEAAAAGKCRVAARVDGIPTVVDDGIDGLLVETESVEELAAALERLIRDPELRRRLGNAARERVAREFSDEVYLSRYGELVSAALERGAR